MTVNHVLITGGAGFIGSHCADYLLEQGVQVTILDNLSSGQLTNLNLRHPEITFIEGDVLEYPLLFDLIKRCDAVLHLAAMASVPLSIEHPVYSMQVNLQGFIHVLQAVRECNMPVRIVYASSASVYGDLKTLPCTEQSPLNPLSPYALQKLNCEQYAEMYQRLFDIKSLGLRFFNVYGARQDPDSPYSGVISRFFDAYQHQKPLTIFGDGLQSRDFIHVSDVSRAIWLALQNEAAGVLNIATGVPQTLLNLIEYIEKAGGKPAERIFKPARRGDIRESYAATDLAEARLGFKAHTSLQEGIALMLEK